VAAPMTHEEVFLQDVLENPDDDAPRLVYADWLLDRGDADGAGRAEFIQLQCALARPGPDAPRAALRARERGLLDAHHRDWAAPLARMGCTCWAYSRGFVEGVALPAAAFLAHVPALARAAPVRHLKLYGAAGLMAAVARSPHLARVRTLDLENNSLDDEALWTLAGSANVNGLEWLDLAKNPIGAGGKSALAARFAGRVRVGG
jgi:uncharacterized protein (TIGR02996 family)